MDADQLHETTMNQQGRRLKQIKIVDEPNAAMVFNNLMGGSVGPRRAFIEKNADKANIE